MPTETPLSESVNGGEFVRGIRDLRKKRSGVGSPSQPAPSPKNTKEYSRLEQWKILGPVLRIQRWYRRTTASRKVAVMKKQREEDLVDELYHDMAIIIQTAWREYTNKKAAREWRAEFRAYTRLSGKK